MPELPLYGKWDLHYVEYLLDFIQSSAIFFLFSLKISESLTSKWQILLSARELLIYAYSSSR